MLKRRLCKATFHWSLKCEGPLLIRDERYARYKGKKEDGFPDCLFMSHTTENEIVAKVKEMRANKQPPQMPFYVPGTSIRGPFRALSERIVRSLLPEDSPPHVTACDPFEQDEENHGNTLGCSKRLEKQENGKSYYASACPACKLFGCAGLASRTQFIDADITEYRSAYRDMIGIDRFTGGVYKGGEGSGGANMRFHVLENTTFTTTITVVNFELWQLGLLAYVLRDFQEGLVPIGYGKTKGFGQVKGAVQGITLTYPSFSGKIQHLGSLIEDERERAYYGIHNCEAPSFEHLQQLENGGLSLFCHVLVTNIDALWTTVAPVFNQYVEQLTSKLKEKTK